MKKTKIINIGGLVIGGGALPRIQSMTNTKTQDADATINQIRSLERAGCELARVAVPDEDAAYALSKIKENIHIPLIADIHFDHRLALIAMDNGADKLRINPGNIGADWKVREVASCAADKGIPIRVGVNSGSLPRKMLEGNKHPDVEIMIKAAEYEIELLEKINFSNIVVSLKASEVKLTIEANRRFSGKYQYPLHLGITEAGFELPAIIKSALGIGILLEEGIGDTFRISLTGDPIDEIRVCKELLKALNLMNEGLNLISCPTCGRAEFPVLELAKEIEKEFGAVMEPITIAVMGCVVNGPGEAREADVGVTGSAQQAVIFVKGEIVDKVPYDQVLESLKRQITGLLNRNRDQG